MNFHNFLLNKTRKHIRETESNTIILNLDNTVNKNQRKLLIKLEAGDNSKSRQHDFIQIRLTRKEPSSG